MPTAEKVTKMNLAYPAGQAPDFINPKEYQPYRFVIGKIGSKMLVALCMNPSKAQDLISDRTVNTVINRSQKEGYDGWAVINIYPERATDKKNLDDFDEELCQQNVLAIQQFIRTHQIKEVWGAWGNAELAVLKKGRDAVLEMLAREAVSLYGYNQLRSGDPHHPLYVNYDKAVKFHCNLK